MAEKMVLQVLADLGAVEDGLYPDRAQMSGVAYPRPKG
jgi:hypothetical protein